MECSLSNMGELNLTMLLQGRSPQDQLGYHTAFEALAAEGTLAGYRPFPYWNAETEDDWTRLFDSVIEHMRTSGSNALLLQYFHGRSIPDPRPFIERVRALPQRPVVATSCGDPFGPFRNAPPPSLTRAASRSDVTFTTLMGCMAKRLERAGARRITLMANSACDVRFGSIPAPPSAADRGSTSCSSGSWPGGRNVTETSLLVLAAVASIDSNSSRNGTESGLRCSGTVGPVTALGKVPLTSTSGPPHLGEPE